MSATEPASRASSASPHSAIRPPGETIPLQFAVAVRSAHRQAVAGARGDELALVGQAGLHLAEPGAEYHGGSASAGSSLFECLRHAGRRDGHDECVNRNREVGHAGHAGMAQDLVAAWVDPPHVALEADRVQVQERLGGVASRPVSRADDGHGRGMEQAPQIDAGSSPRHRQWIVASTPRRSSAREMMSRWISLVPSQIRSTRSSRRNRSATLLRM
jgi:hypothetical protein